MAPSNSTVYVMCVTFFPTVIFSVPDALSGNYLFVVETYDGGVTIWSKAVPESTLVIPTIVCQ